MGETPNIDIVEQYFKESGIPYEKGAGGGLFSPNFFEADIGITSSANGKLLLNVCLTKGAHYLYYRTTDVVEAYKLIARYYFEDIIDTKFKNP